MEVGLERSDGVGEEEEGDFFMSGSETRLEVRLENGDGVGREVERVTS